MVETQEKPDDHIYDTLQTGYRLGERLIRAAMVRGPGCHLPASS